MPGRIELAFHREPSYFAPGGRFGPIQQTIVCPRRQQRRHRRPRDGTRDRRDGLPRGPQRAHRRSTRSDRLPVDAALGGASPVGDAAGQGLPATSGSCMPTERRPATSPPSPTGTTVALDILTSNRAGLPRYRPAGRYLTFAIATRASSRRRRRHDAQRDPGRGDPPPHAGRAIDIDEIVGFLAGHGKSRPVLPGRRSRRLRRRPHGPQRPAPAKLSRRPPATVRPSPPSPASGSTTSPSNATGPRGSWGRWRSGISGRSGKRWSAGYDRTLRAVRPSPQRHVSAAPPPAVARARRIPRRGLRCPHRHRGRRSDRCRVAPSTPRSPERGPRGLEYVLFGCHEDRPARRRGRAPGRSSPIRRTCSSSAGPRSRRNRPMTTPCRSTWRSDVSDRGHPARRPYRRPWISSRSTSAARCTS